MRDQSIIARGKNDRVPLQPLGFEIRQEGHATGLVPPRPGDTRTLQRLLNGPEKLIEFPRKFDAIS